MQQAEVSKAQAAQAKNELEAYIISTQGRLGDDEEVQAVTTDKQRQAFQKDLSQVEEWLYDQGEHEQASVFRCETPKTARERKATKDSALCMIMFFKTSTPENVQPKRVLTSDEVCVVLCYPYAGLGMHLLPVMSQLPVCRSTHIMHISSMSYALCSLLCCLLVWVDSVDLRCRQMPLLSPTATASHCRFAALSGCQLLLLLN